ncbi:uncharacterized protein ACOB8E_012997 [Sarcophilus harrisii]
MQCFGTCCEKSRPFRRTAEGGGRDEDLCACPGHAAVRQRRFLSCRQARQAQTNNPASMPGASSGPQSCDFYPDPATHLRELLSSRGASPSSAHPPAPRLRASSSWGNLLLRPVEPEGLGGRDVYFRHLEQFPACRATIDAAFTYMITTAKSLCLPTSLYHYHSKRGIKSK